MAINGTYKSSLDNIQFLSGQVFSLDKSYRMILRCLVNKNNSELGASLAEICRFTANAEPPLLRKGVSMRIHGTNRTIGLIPLDFIYQKKEKKHRWGKQESTFHITFKGLMAVLGCGISLKKIYLYKNYIKYLTSFVDDQKIVNLIEEHIKNEINIFLLWHYVTGIQLTKLNMSNEYFMKFMNQPNLFHSIVVSYKWKKQFPLEHISKIFVSYLSTKYIIFLLGDKNIVPSLDPQFKNTDEYDIMLTSPLMKDRLKARLFKFISEWPNLIENLHRQKSVLSIVTISDYYPPTKFYNVEINSKKIERQIKNQLKNLNLSISIPTKTTEREMIHGF